MGKNARRKKRLDKYCAKFVETVEVQDILCYFPKMTKGTKELILRKANNEGSRAGAYELYMKITKADSDWYDYLMTALREAGYLDLLRLLQDDDDDDDGNDGAASQHSLADSRTSLSKSSTTNTVKQPIHYPHQEIAHSISANAGQSPQSTQQASLPQSTQRASPPLSPQWASTPLSPQRASSPQSPQQASSPLSPELLTNTSQNITRHQPDQPAVEMDIVPQQSTPLSPEAYTRPGEDNHQANRESTRVFHREPEEVPCMNELTLGQVHQGVREAFNKLMNDNNVYSLNWKSLADKLNMTVDEVNSIQGAPQLYEILRARGMKLVELVQHLQEMERADLVSEIKKFHDLSDMCLPDRPVERQSSNVSRQTSKKAAESMLMWEQDENKQEIKVKEIHKQQPDFGSDQIKRNLDEVSNVGKNLMNFEPEKQVKREPVIERSLPAQMIDSPAPGNDSEPMMSTAMNIGSSAASAEPLVTMPYVYTPAPDSLNSVNQPPFDSYIEQSASVVLESVPGAPESREDRVGQHVEEMGDAHEKEDKDDHEEDHQEVAENVVPQNSDSEGSPVAPPSNASSESTMASKARRVFSVLSDGALVLTIMNRF